MRARWERKKKRIVHSHLVVKKKTDFIHSYVRNCIMFLIGRERRRCLYVSGVRRTPKWLKNRVIIDLSRVDAEVAVCVEGKLANARLRDVSDTILLSSSILYVWIDWVEAFCKLFPASTKLRSYICTESRLHQHGRSFSLLTFAY